MTHLCLKTSLPVLCVLMTLVCMASGDTCDREIENCHTPLRQYSNFTENLNVLYKASTQDHLDEVCRVYKGVKQCVVNVKHHCSAETLTKFDGLDNAYEYMCGEGKNKYLRLRPCLLKDDLEIELDKCFIDYNETVHDAPIGASNLAYCGYEEDFLSCGEKWTKFYCGDEAESFDRHLNKLYYGPRMRHYKCPGWIITKPVTAGDACTREIGNCHTPLRQYSSTTHNFNVLFRAETQQHLDDICSVYKGVKQCVVYIKHYCTAWKLTTYDGLDNTYEYMCGEGGKTYLQIQQCLGKEKLQDQLDKCFTDYEKAADDARTWAVLRGKEFSICSYDEDYFSCSEKWVKSSCGVEAGSFYRRIFKLYYGPRMGHLECPGWPTTKRSSGTSTRPVTGSLVAAAFLCWFLLYVMREF